LTAARGHQTEWSFNEDSRLDGKLAQVEYETIEKSTTAGLRYCGQVVSSSTSANAHACAHAHNPALVLDWNRFCSDTIIAYARMQADVLHEICPTFRHVNLRALTEIRSLRHGRSRDFVPLKRKRH